LSDYDNAGTIPLKPENNKQGRMTTGCCKHPFSLFPLTTSFKMSILSMSNAKLLVKKTRHKKAFKRQAQGMSLLRRACAFLLDLSLRFQYLPGLHERKYVGNVL
jgi:hypothetical protein